MKELKIEDLIKAGAHFGHPVSKWDPNFNPFIIDKKNGIHIINLRRTISAADKVLKQLIKIVENGGNILFVGTKPQAKDIIQSSADKCGMFYIIERWLGGTLTNFSTIKKSIKRLKMLEKESSPIYKDITKKERAMLSREKLKLSDLHRGIKDMKYLPDALFVVDAKHESIAVSEAKCLGIPTFGLVDTNTNPNYLDFPITSNDDSIKSIKIILDYLSDSIFEVIGSKVTSDIPNAMETVIASPIPIATFISVPTATPVPTSTPDTKIISIDPMNNPEQFISEIPIPEINCLTEIFNSKTEIITLITSPPGQYLIDNDLAKNSDECLSYDSKERIIIGLLDFSSGKLTDKTKSCIKDVGVGKSSFIYLFAKDPPPEIYLITLQSVFCLNKNERSIFEKSNYGQITSSMGGIDKIECFINELGPLGLINFDEPLKFIGGTYTINQLSPSVLEKFLSC